MKFILPIFFLLAALKVAGQEYERLPEFPGGSQGLYCFIDSMINKDLLSESELRGMVVAKFTISENGKVRDIQIIKPLHPSIDEEWIRVLQQMPDWKPGMLMGKPVDVIYNIPLGVPYKGRCE